MEEEHERQRCRALSYRMSPRHNAHVRIGQGIKVFGPGINGPRTMPIARHKQSIYSKGS